jgi:hypothetical protein
VLRLGQRAVRTALSDPAETRYGGAVDVKRGADLYAQGWTLRQIGVQLEPPLDGHDPVTKRLVSCSARWLGRAAVLALAVLLLGLAACTQVEPNPVPSPPSGSSQDRSRSASPSAGVNKVLLIVEENRSVDDVAAHMPFLMSEARSYGAATNFMP